MQPTTAQVGPLVCRIFGDLARSQGVVVLCHGFGAPGTDLVGLGSELHRLDSRLGQHIAMVFPEAPIDLGPMYFGGRAWWHIEVGRFADATTREDLLALAAEVPEGLKAARRMMQQTVDAILKQSGLTMGQVLLGGFSQGSMLATDVALRAEEAPAALCIFSGALVAKDEWAANAPRRKGLKVIQTHGREDAILPFFVGEALKEMLDEAGLDVTFTPFHGPHTISGDGVVQLAKLSVEQLGRGG